MTVISGTLIYRERIALIPGGTATITLCDLSLGRGTAPGIAKTTIELGDQQIPIPVEVSTESVTPVAGGSYGLVATITGPERAPEWTTPTALPADLDRDRIEVGPLVLVRATSDQPSRLLRRPSSANGTSLPSTRTRSWPVRRQP